LLLKSFWVRSSVIKLRHWLTPSKMLIRDSLVMALSVRLRWVKRHLGDESRTLSASAPFCPILILFL